MQDLYANWARVYDYFYPDRSDEIEFWAGVANVFGPRVLDLMCGTAEVSLGLARRGHYVAGVDLSPAMLAVGAERLAAAADYQARSLSLVQGNTSAIPSASAAFDFALVGGNGSFNHLDDEQALTALHEMRRVLRPGGGLGMELVNPQLLEEVYPERTFGPFRPVPPGVWVEKTVTNRYDRSGKRFQIRQLTVYEIDGKRGEFQESFALHVREPKEVQALLSVTGFAGIELYADYERGAFGQWSPDLLVVAKVPSPRKTLTSR